MSTQEFESNSCNSCNSCPRPKTHNHEILGSTFLKQCGCETHNHRFAGVSGPAIMSPNNHHKHNVKTYTDTYDGHSHEITSLSSDEIYVGDNRHVHFIKDQTEMADGHRHGFRVATLIDNPIED